MKDKYLIVILIILVFVLYGLTKIQYHPKELIIQSKDFIQLLYKDDLKSAYELTSKKVGYYDYSTSMLFKKAVERQALSFLQANEIKIKYKSNFPYQTYGNRIRRWFSERNIDVKQKDIDFRINITDRQGINSDIGFEVRWELQADNSWKIVFFQSHAY